MSMPGLPKCLLFFADSSLQFLDEKCKQMHSKRQQTLLGCVLIYVKKKKLFFSPVWIPSWLVLEEAERKS